MGRATTVRSTWADVRRYCRLFDSRAGKAAGTDVPPQGAQVSAHVGGGQPHRVGACICKNRFCGRANRNSAFKIRLQAMFIDTSLNGVPAVLANLYQSFHEAAVRLFGYARTLARTRRVRPSLLISTWFRQIEHLESIAASGICTALSIKLPLAPAEHY